MLIETLRKVSQLVHECMSNRNVEFPLITRLQLQFAKAN